MLAELCLLIMRIIRLLVIIRVRPYMRSSRNCAKTAQNIQTALVGVNHTQPLRAFRVIR